MNNTVKEYEETIMALRYKLEEASKVFNVLIEENKSLLEANEELIARNEMLNDILMKHGCDHPEVFKDCPL